MHTKVNTKSLLGRPALIGQLMENKPKGSPKPAGSPTIAEEAVDAQTRLFGGGKKTLNFNNNIYNNFTPDYSIESVSPAKRLLPKIDQQRVELIKRLKKDGKIKTLGRSPVPLQLYEETDAKDHLYISTVTKRVPVAHD